MSGHGGALSKASVTGIWACDFKGDPRLLFRTGAQIDAGPPGTPLLKKLKSFTLLKATVGSTGVTRSFNHTTRVAWLATFTDKTQAIVVTGVPQSPKALDCGEHRRSAVAAEPRGWPPLLRSPTESGDARRTPKRLRRDHG